MGRPSLHSPPSAQPAGPAAYLSSCRPPSPCRRNRRRSRRGREGWTSGRGRGCREPPPASGTGRRCSRARAGRWPPWRGLAKRDWRPFWVSMGAAWRSADPPALLPASAPHPGPNSLLAGFIIIIIISPGFREPAGIALPPRAPLCDAPAPSLAMLLLLLLLPASPLTARATTKGKEGEMEAVGGGEEGSGVHVMPMPPASSPGTGTEGGVRLQVATPPLSRLPLARARSGGGTFRSARAPCSAARRSWDCSLKKAGRTLARATPSRT